jgi:1,4-alpha-glucan branching enzyme
MPEKIKNIKKVILFLPFLFTGFISIENKNSTEYYYNFQQLKEAQSPRETKVINTANVEKGKSLIEYGVLITYKNRSARNVKIGGDFSNWQLADMSKGKFGVWYYFLTKLKMTRYKFMVDGIWINDPVNIEKEDDDLGSYVSIIEPMNFSDNNNLTYRFVGKQTVEFRIFNPKAKFVAIVGDFNNWNPENDLLEKKKSGVWTLKKRLFPGIYKYKYIIDGEWTVDLYNSRTARDNAEGICSLIRIEK